MTKEPTQEEKDLKRVKEDGSFLEFVDNQTEEICLAAVKQFAGALIYVKNQTNKICLTAVKNDRIAINYIRDKDLKKLLLNKNTRDFFINLKEPNLEKKIAVMIKLYKD